MVHLSTSIIEATGGMRQRRDIEGGANAAVEAGGGGGEKEEEEAAVFVVLGEATRVIDGLLSVGIVPHVSTFNALLRCAAKSCAYTGSLSPHTLVVASGRIH
jgi:hypothetical protein